MYYLHSLNNIKSKVLIVKSQVKIKNILKYLKKKYLS